MSPKIVDCFIFYNELDLLEYRLSILYPIVDFFVICEASRTFVGNPKPFFYEENRDRYSCFADKIIHVKMTDSDTQWIINPDKSREEQWMNENTHRDGISRGVYRLLSEHKICYDDFVTICDLDEIPNPGFLESVKTKLLSPIVAKEGGMILSMDFYYYNLNCIHKRNKWELAKMVLVGAFVNLFRMKPQLLRHARFSLKIGRGGWHLSYFGDENFIKNKIQNFAHQELNVNEFTDSEKIRERVANNRDLYDRPNEEFGFISVNENMFLPKDWDKFEFFSGVI